MAMHLMLFAIDMYREFPEIFHDGALPQAGDLTVNLYECEVFSQCVYSPAL
jgi:hypothetical protein